MAQVLSRIVEVCVFRMDGDAPQYLLLQRSESDELYPLLWQIVTGTREPNERAFDAAQREFEEETGLPRIRAWNVPYVDSYYDISRDNVEMIPFFAFETGRESTPALSSEHRRFEWLAFPQARERLVWPGQRRGLEIVHEYIVGGKEAGRLQLICA